MLGVKCGFMQGVSLPHPSLSLGHPEHKGSSNEDFLCKNGNCEILKPLIISPSLSRMQNFVCRVFLLLALNVTVTSKVMWELFSGTVEACKVTGIQSCSLCEGNRD